MYNVSPSLRAKSSAIMVLVVPESATAAKANNSLWVAEHKSDSRIISFQARYGPG